VREVAARIRQLDEKYSGRAFPPEARAEWNALNEDLEVHRRHERIEQVAGTDREEAGVSYDRREVVTGRDAALRAVERAITDNGLRSGAADRLDQHVREIDRRGLDARYISAVADPAYRSAFSKLLIDPSHGHLRHTPQEVQAMRVVNEAVEQRGMVTGTGSAGGFAIPFTLDPSIMATSDGALNPIRDIAKVITIATHDWKGLSSAGVTASYDAEAAEVSDDTPTLAQPTITTAMGRAFVPFSFELGDDWATLEQELLNLIADARDRLDAVKFLTGSGTNEPAGVLTGLSVSQRVQTASAATYAVADPWTLKAAIPPRFQANTTFAAAGPVWDTTFRFVGGNSTEPLQFDSGRGGPFLGAQKVEWSAMATTLTTGSKIMLAGDFREAYVIADRIGMSVELVPHLAGANRRPSGERGFFARWRCGAAVVNANALRYLEVQ